MMSADKQKEENTTQILMLLYCASHVYVFVYMYEYICILYLCIYLTFV